jgi:lipopolysaccharide export system protein LptA
MMARGLFIIVIWLIFAAGLYAAEVAGGERNNQPIQIKSSELTTDSANRTATFTGKVSARQGDVIIYCDRLLIFYSEKEKEVDKVEAFGNVRIVQGNGTAQAGHAVYENKAGKIILDDNPRVYQGENIVTGKVITYFLDSQRSQATSAPGEPVIAIIHPKEKGKDGGAKR